MVENSNDQPTELGGMWDDVVNPRTGEHSLKIHELKTVKTWCKNDGHNLIIQDMGKRISECVNCGQEITFVVGKDTVNSDGSVTLG